jgi:XTP/dITP diphosphohydrolase
MKLLFATNNPKKVEELKSKLKHFTIVTLNEHGINEDIPETSETLEGNASQKANYIKNKYNIDCFADDTGLEIEDLNGEPGVYSARYGGEDRDSNKNMDLVLQKLANKTNRDAQFKTVISLILNGIETQFTGIVKGTIIDTKKGGDGFGYDPIFVPRGYTKTFAEMTLEEKNTISHRALAVDKLVEFLKER